MKTRGLEPTRSVIMGPYFWERLERRDRSSMVDLEVNGGVLLWEEKRVLVGIHYFLWF